MKYHNQEKITTLNKYEVFVFGTNASGFHGAGSAGYAFKGDTKNDWRTNPKCQAAIQAINNEENEEDMVGKWAVWGIAEGLMKGREGKSYGIITTQRPGFQGYVNLEFIKQQIIKLIKLAAKNPKYSFLLVPLGLSREFGGYSWFTLIEMKNIFNELDKEIGIPDNILLPPKFQ